LLLVCFYYYYYYFSFFRLVLSSLSDRQLIVVLRQLTAGRPLSSRCGEEPGCKNSKEEVFSV